MSRIFIINRKQLTLAVIIGVFILFTVFYFKSYVAEDHVPVAGTITEERLIHMVTGEFKGKNAKGEEIEAYRWDPGTIFVQEGENIKQSIYGVSGASHPFIIEGLNIKDEVKQGQETIVSFKAEKKGIYRIICTNHPDIQNNGPMIGYIVIQ